MNGRDTEPLEHVAPPLWALEEIGPPGAAAVESMTSVEEDESPNESATAEAQAPPEAQAESPDQAEPDADAVRDRAIEELISGAQMANKSYKREHFLIGPKLLPVGGRMLITAETGTGKSALALHIAACIITGKPLFGLLRAKKDADHGKPYFPVLNPGNVLYLDFELPEHIRWEERLSRLTKEFGVDFLKDIYFPKKPSELRLDAGDGFEKLRRLTRALRPGVTIIDPLSSTHSVDENTNSLKQPLNRIDQLIEESGTTVILIHHSSAKKARNMYGDVVEKGAKERPRGHSSLVDWADVQLQLETINAKERERYPDDDEEAEPVRTLGLDFGKTRYCPTPQRRKIEADIGEMHFGRAHRTQAQAQGHHTPSKNRENEGGTTTAVESTA